MDLRYTRELDLEEWIELIPELQTTWPDVDFQGSVQGIQIKEDIHITVANPPKNLGSPNYMIQAEKAAEMYNAGSFIGDHWPNVKMAAILPMTMIDTEIFATLTTPHYAPHGSADYFSQDAIIGIGDHLP